MSVTTQQLDAEVVDDGDDPSGRLALPVRRGRQPARYQPDPDEVRNEYLTDSPLPEDLREAGKQARELEAVSADWKMAAAAPKKKDFDDERDMWSRHRRRQRFWQRLTFWRQRRNERYRGKVDARIERTDLRQELHAKLGNEKLRKLTNPVAKLAAQHMWRLVALMLFAIPTIGVVVAGSVQVHDAAVELFHVRDDSLWYYVLYLVEGFASLMLAGLLVVDGTDPGISAAEEARLGAKDHLRRFRRNHFFVLKIVLIALELVINVGPRLALKQYEAAAGMAVIPLVLIIALTALPRVNRIYMERIRDAGIDAALEAPAGKFLPSQAKNVRLLAIAVRRLGEGTFKCNLDPETGLPLNPNQCHKGLLEITKTVSVPTANWVFNSLHAWATSDEVLVAIR